MKIIIVLGVIQLILVLLGLFIKNKSSFIIRLIDCSGIGVVTWFIIKNRDIFFDIGYKKALVWLCLVVYCIITLFLMLIIVKAKNKFGNYFIITLGFFKNLIQNTTICKDPDRIYIGNIIPYNRKTMPYSGYLLNIPHKFQAGGMIISGATGTGKTYTIKNFVKQDIDKGNGVIYFDFKGDSEVRDELIDYAESHGYDVYCFNRQDKEFFFDPLSNLTSEGRVEALLSLRKWDISGKDDHYRQNLKLVAQKYIHLFDQYIQDDEELSQIRPEELMYTRIFYNFVTKNKPDLTNIDIKQAYNTLKTQLELLLTGPMKNSLQNNNLQAFSFEDKSIYNDYKWLMIVSIPSENKELANSIMNLYIKNMIHVGTHEPFGNWIKFYVDEFGTVSDPMSVKDLLEKGRSMKICTLISMQDINQIVINANEAYLDSLLGCARNYLIFSGTTADAARKISGVQIKDIDKILQSLRGPGDDNNPFRPTAAFITKNSLLSRESSEVYKIFPGKNIMINEVLGTDGEFEETPAGKISGRAKDKLFVDMMNNDFF